jgi:hypothetical protein
LYPRAGIDSIAPGRFYRISKALADPRRMEILEHIARSWLAPLCAAKLMRPRPPFRII